MRGLAWAVALSAAVGWASVAKAAEDLSTGLSLTSASVQPKTTAAPPTPTPAPSMDFSQAANSQYLGG